MNSKNFMNTRADLNSLCNRILEDRSPQYAGADEGNDRFANFKLIAELFANFGVDTGTPEGVLAVYMMKHSFAILSYLGKNRTPEACEVVLTSNIPDNRNYLDLLYALIKEGTKVGYIPGKPCPECGYTCQFPERHPRCCKCNPSDFA